MKLVSIALATWNGEKFLPQQLESILRQTHTNLEIIICDDGSSDKTVHIIESFMRNDPRVHLFQNETPLGVLKNFEKAIALCSGEYIALSDQDDIWVHDKIELMLNALDESVMAYHDDFLMRTDATLEADSLFSFWQIVPIKTNYTKALLFDNWISGHTMLFRSVLKDFILPIDTQVGFHDLWIALVASKVGTVRYIDRSLVYWRQHESNTSGNKLTRRSWTQKVFYPIDQETFVAWNRHRIERLTYLKHHPLFISESSFIDAAINYYSAQYRLKAFIFALFNITYIVHHKSILKKIKYLILPLFAPKVKI